MCHMLIVRAIGAAPAATTLVGFEMAVLVPPALVAMTARRMVAPTSAVPTS
jgi:hypothetical protein